MNLISENNEYKNKLLDNFVRYVKIWSESNSELADQGKLPSTPQQWDMAHQLEKELTELGVKEVVVTENCYVYGYIPGNIEESEPILLLAHMDTVDEVSGKNVKPQLKNTDDGDVIISTDHTTLLGGDDKAGVAAIMTALEYLIKNPEVKHRPFEVIFSPDEETGHGMDKVPLELIKSKCGYTVDGGDEGEMETECFNAFAANLHFTGKASHTGNAKEMKMVNAATMAGNFIQGLPRDKAPETTENFEGFIAVMEVKGGIEAADVCLFLRAFNMKEIEEEKTIIRNLADKVSKDFGGKIEVEFKQQYLNMKEKMDEHPEVVERLEVAYKEAGVKIKNVPIRGGTDGSRLTEMGIPTPNIFTGAHEYHSRNEWVSLNQMAKASDIVINLLIGK